MTRQNLITALQENIKGDACFDSATRHIYATDASDFRKVPLAVVMPKTVEDISFTMSLASEHDFSTIPRGGGSSVSGQTVGPGIVIDHTKYMNRLISVNAEEKWAWVEAGMNLDNLNHQLLEYNLMVGPDPSSSAVATIGGMVGNNSTGSHSIKYKQIADHVLEMEAVLSNGEIVTFGPKTKDEVGRLASLSTLEGKIYKGIIAILDKYDTVIENGYPAHWRNVAGYALNRIQRRYREDSIIDLASLISGSEGTLVSISKVKLGLVQRPSYTRLTLLPFEDLTSALEMVPTLLSHPVAAVELMTYPTLRLAYDHPIYSGRLKQFLSELPGALLIVEFAGEGKEAVESDVADMRDSLRKAKYNGKPVDCLTAVEIDRVWSIRKAVKGLQDSKPGATKRINVIDDPTVPVEELVSFTREVTKVGERFGVDLNFDAHASVGCLHLSPAINLRTPEGLQTMEKMAKEIMTIAIAHHGTTTGEHGEGLARSFFNKQLYGKELHQAFGDTKNLFDPENRYNPYKILNTIDPWNTDWLKFRPGYKTEFAPDKTYFDYGAHKSFAGLIEMCNGQGTCRSLVNGAMCPSFRVTGNEKDSPRGRANILREALTGNLGNKGLLSPEVYETLDFCLECKACKSECSSGLDVAKLKYEFLTHYQKAKGVPLRTRAFASLNRLNRLARLSPGIVSWVYQRPVFKRTLERVLKIDHRRDLPLIAKQSFQKWFRQRQSTRSSTKGPVILWDDCHLSDNHPELGQAAVTVLESLGFEVRLVEGKKCCGRPLISKGLLDKAKQNAVINIGLLSPFAEQGIPIVGIEPSCVACFRDEYVSLVPGDASKTLASQTYFIEEFVRREIESQGNSILFKDQLESQRILVHTHCYQKALDQVDQVLSFLKLIPNVIVEEIGDGCCGMAGSFGYETEHYDISMKIGEKNLFHYIRSAPSDSRFSAAGISCRQQIKDGTGKSALHPVMIFSEAIKTP